MSRIALVLGTSSGGVGNHVRSLGAGLAARGHRVAVLGPALTQERFDFAAAGPRFAAVGIGAGPSPRDPAAAVRLRRLTRGADVVHAHGIRAGALCALAGAAPLVVTAHNAPPELAGPRSWVFPLLERITARRADTVLGVSGDLVRRLRAAGAHGARLATVAAPPMAAPRRTRDQVRAELGVPRERPLLLTVARLAPQKGLDVLVDAAPRIAARRPAPVIAVAGGGPLRPELERRAAARGADVRLLGQRGDVADLLAAADLFCLTSHWEGPSLVIMEALRAGLPVVATRVGGIPDLYTGTVLMVPPGRADALAAAVGRVLDEPELAADLRRKARDRAVTLPTEQDAVQQVLQVYAAACPRWPGSPG